MRTHDSDTRALKHRLPARTWFAIVVAGAGIARMYGSQVSGGSARQWLGARDALAVSALIANEALALRSRNPAT